MNTQGMTVERRDGVVILTMGDEDAQRLATILRRHAELLDSGKVKAP